MTIEQKANALTGETSASTTLSGLSQNAIVIIVAVVIVVLVITVSTAIVLRATGKCGKKGSQPEAITAKPSGVALDTFFSATAEAADKDEVDDCHEDERL